ncbi:MAG: hypothetical protein NC401_18125 [Ruminococcus sp.]|nr:hypothetical protein [Ruminococcus sp.]
MTEKQANAIRQFEELAAKIGSEKKAGVQIGMSSSIISQLRNNRAWQRQQLRTLDVRREDIEMLIPMLKGKEQELEFLHKIAQTAEGVRGAVRLFGNAYDMGKCDFNGLVKMAKMMHLDLRGMEKAVRRK